MFLPTSTTCGPAAHLSAGDGDPLAVHAPAVPGGVPALHGQEVAVRVTLGLEGAENPGLQAALGLQKMG